MAELVHRLEAVQADGPDDPTHGLVEGDVQPLGHRSDEPAVEHREVIPAKTRKNITET